jgi:ankyrin repeat protein
MILNNFNFKYLITGFCLKNLKLILKKILFYIVLIGFLPAYGQSYDQFFRAIEFDDAVTVQNLLRRGFDPNTPSAQLQPALTLALQKKSLKVAETLIAWRSINVNQLNANDESPLMLAALQGHLRLAEQLIARGADVNKTGWTPLHYAATGGHADLIQLLLEHHAYIDAESPNGTTPLMMAAYYGNPKVTHLLLQEGADPTLKNQKGLTAYDFAYNGPFKESLAIIESFLKAIPAR